MVGESISACFGFEPIGDLQVLCPMARGGCSSRALNITLQQLVNQDLTEQMQRFGWLFAPGDKVMQIASDDEKEVFNGDLGSIDAIDSDNRELSVLSPEHRPRRQSQAHRGVWLGGGAGSAGAGLCRTIHQSQAREYPAGIPLW